MSYGARTITISKPIAKTTRRRSRKARKLRTYWAEIGFILLAVMFLQPQLFQSLMTAIASSPGQSILP